MLTKPKLVLVEKPSLTINAAPVTIETNESTGINQTLDGFMILTLQNLSPSKATLLYSSGGSTPQQVDIDGGNNAPQIVINNWGANNLTITNLSSKDGTQVAVGLYGLGTPSKNLPESEQIELTQYQSAGRKTPVSFANLALASFGSPQTTIYFVFSVGKPVAYAVNVSDPSFYPGYVTDSGNQKKVINNWQGRDLFVINVSTHTSPGQVRFDPI
ncbi:hypothetical protein D7X99_37040 [Corallococcus sp. AB032C]|uniref:hypothetical protein n=1 Tax=Corallococcus TaxID=83461 RepID=UPI000ED4D27D|nr:MULTISPECIES: hypothetical protein [Corallococcus]NPC49627.1 hypothetical protein [Corallococcus exiguus]NPC73195.1 hypothetical protein [Corallococcus exiguus]RKH75805.1 hypothetical protein D7X99_37040 [Corallococcus sp. AB032C]